MLPKRIISHNPAYSVVSQPVWASLTAHRCKKTVLNSTPLHPCVPMCVPVQVLAFTGHFLKRQLSVRTALQSKLSAAVQSPELVKGNSRKRRQQHLTLRFYLICVLYGQLSERNQGEMLSRGSGEEHWVAEGSDYQKPDYSTREQLEGTSPLVWFVVLIGRFWVLYLDLFSAITILSSAKSCVCRCPYAAAGFVCKKPSRTCSENALTPEKCFSFVFWSAVVILLN